MDRPTRRSQALHVHRNRAVATDREPAVAPKRPRLKSRWMKFPSEVFSPSAQLFFIGVGPRAKKPPPPSAVHTCSDSCPSGDALARPDGDREPRLLARARCRGMGCAAAIHRWLLQRFPSVYLMLRHREARKSRNKSPKNTLALRARGHVLSPYWAWWAMTLDLTYGQGESRSNGLSWPHLAF